MIRLRTRPAALFLALLLVALIVFLPMRLVLGFAAPAGFSARAVSGTVWRGRLSEARVGSIALGDLRAGLSPFDLLIGRVRLRVRGDSGADPLRATITVARHGLQLDGVNAALPGATLFAPLPVSSLMLDDVAVRFRDGLCEAASGRVRTGLAGDLGGVALGGSLEGAVRCEATALLVPLASAAGDQSIVLRIRGDGRYRADLSTTPADPTMAARLAAIGFRRNGAAMRLTVEGRLR